MTEPVKPLPAGLEQYESIKALQQLAQRQADRAADAQGKPRRTLTPAQFQVHNEDPKDGKFQIFYLDPELDLEVVAEVEADWQRMWVVSRKPSEMQKLLQALESGTLSQGEFDRDSNGITQRLAALEMKDGCSITKAAGAEGELAQKNCQDGILHPSLLEAAKKFPVIADYEAGCKASFENYLQTRWSGKAVGSPFDLNRTRVYSTESEHRLGTYRIDFENPMNNFSCTADISLTGGNHIIALSHGDMQFSAEAERQFQPLNYGCDLTLALGMEQVFVGSCQNWTPEQRRISEGTGNALTYGGYALAGSGIYSLGSAGFRWVAPNVYASSLGRINAPIARLSSAAYHYTLGYATRPMGRATGAAWRALAARLPKPTFLRGFLARLPQLRGVVSQWAAQGIKGAAQKVGVGGVISMGVRAIPFLVDGVIIGNITGDYLTWVNQRATDKLYEDEVYCPLNWRDAFVVPFVARGVFIGARFLLPHSMDNATLIGLPQYTDAVMLQDWQDSETARDTLREQLAALLPKTNFADLQNPDAKAQRLLAALEKPVELSHAEASLLHRLDNASSQERDVILEGLSQQVGDAQVERFLEHIHLYQIQEAAAFLVFTELPVNDWAREIFQDDDGILTMKPGRAEVLLAKLYPNEAAWVAASQQGGKSS
jgi:hypothetical protein